MGQSSGLVGPQRNKVSHSKVCPEEKWQGQGLLQDREALSSAPPAYSLWDPRLTPVWEESVLWNRSSAWPGQDSDTSAWAPSKGWGHLPPLSVGNPMPIIWFWKVHEVWSQGSGWKSKLLPPQTDGLGEVTLSLSFPVLFWKLGMYGTRLSG